MRDAFEFMGTVGLVERVVIPQVQLERKGVVLAPDGSEQEVEGILNPAVARDRAGSLLLYPRMVAAGNVSSIGLVRGRTAGKRPAFERLGVALDPQTEYERRPSADGHGCEDPRVTFVPLLDAYVMCYTAFGPAGARVAMARSRDGYAWERLGLVEFADGELNHRDNKDAALFPEPVSSPNGVRCFAFYHRPMLHGTVKGQTPVATLVTLDPADREGMCIAYVPVTDVERDVRMLCVPTESVRVLDVGTEWGTLKNGAGTPPVRTEHGWLEVFHGVDPVQRDGALAMSYSAGLAIHDLEQPHRIVYRSPEPIFSPETSAERFGTVDDVVFPTGIDVTGDGVYDVYYGAADAKISLARLTVTF